MDNDLKKNETMDKKLKKRPPPISHLPIQVESNETHSSDNVAHKESNFIAKSDQSADSTLEKRRLDRKVSHNRYSQEIRNMNITREQRDKLQEFLMKRVQIESLSNEDFAIEGELGAGNGGVVQKVRHRKTGIEMAKKVLIFLDLDFIWPTIVIFFEILAYPS
jgi:hypothetical protein